ncbi:hypothetical protein SVAN01_02459 [Stagonosporopsis vannaccii]|nr:hypothetical protein SVAN01_02459 [Stagonosporopsis vannaccii]
MKLSRTLRAKVDVAAVQSSAGLRCSKVNCRTTRAWRGTGTQRPGGGISNVRGDWRAGDPMQRAGVLRRAPEAAGQLGPVPGASGAADGWRLEVAHGERGRSGLPKRIGGGENKASAGSAQALGGQHAQAEHSAQPEVWTCVQPRDGFEVEELAAEWKANRHEFDQQGHRWEGPINEGTAAQNKAGRTWESFNRGLVVTGQMAVQMTAQQHDICASLSAAAHRCAPSSSISAGLHACASRQATTSTTLTYYVPCTMGAGHHLGRVCARDY